MDPRRHDIHSARRLCELLSGSKDPRVSRLDRLARILRNRRSARQDEAHVSDAKQNYRAYEGSFQSRMVGSYRQYTAHKSIKGRFAGKHNIAYTA